MAIRAWKKFETSPDYQRLKVKAKRLVGQELRLIPDIQLETVCDGGWTYDASLLNELSIVYSLGVGDLIDFDLGVIDRCQSRVFAFDPTPTSKSFVDREDRPKQFHFQPWAAAGEDGSLSLFPRVRNDGSLSTDMFTLIAEEASRESAIVVPAYTVDTLARKLGHARIDLLKMDIEGAEFEVLDALIAGQLRPKQLLIEFHHRFIDNGLARTSGIVERLRAEDYKLYSVCAETGREVSFLHQP
jgi:FkbM family methyltransferase